MEVSKEKKEVIMEEEKDESLIIHNMPVTIITLEDILVERDTMAQVIPKELKKEVFINDNGKYNGVQMSVGQYMDLVHAMTDFRSIGWNIEVRKPIDPKKIKYRFYNLMLPELQKIIESILNSKGNPVFPPVNPILYKMYGYIGTGKEQSAKLDLDFFPKDDMPLMDGALQLVMSFEDTLKRLNKLKPDEIIQTVQRIIPKGEILFRRLPNVINEDHTLFPYLFLSTNNQWKQIYVNIGSIKALIKDILGENGDMYMLLESKPKVLHWTKNVVIIKDGVKQVTSSSMDYFFQKAIYMDVFGNMAYGILGGNPAYGAQVQQSLLERDIFKKIFPFFNDLEVLDVRDIVSMNKKIEAVKMIRNAVQGSNQKFDQAFSRLVTQHGDALITNMTNVFSTMNGQIAENPQVKQSVVYSLPSTEQNAGVTILPLEDDVKVPDRYTYTPVEKEKSYLSNQTILSTKGYELPRGTQKYAGQKLYREGNEQQNIIPPKPPRADVTREVRKPLKPVARPIRKPK